MACPEERLLDGRESKSRQSGRRRRPEVPHQRAAAMISPAEPTTGAKGGRGMVWYGMPYGIGSGWRAAPSRSPCLGPGSGARLP